MVEEIAGVCAVTARIVVEGNTDGIAAIVRYVNKAQRQRATAHVLADDTSQRVGADSAHPGGRINPGDENATDARWICW